MMYYKLVDIHPTDSFYPLRGCLLEQLFLLNPYGQRVYRSARRGYYSGFVVPLTAFRKREIFFFAAKLVPVIGYRKILLPKGDK
jgi:hypothetical protein